MACALTSGRVKQCKQSLGGNSRLYLFDYIDDPFTHASGVATAKNAGLTDSYEYELEGDGNTLVESFVSDRQTGTSVNTQTITVVLKKISAADVAELDLLTYSFAQAVVKDRNGIYHAIGINDGIDWSVESTTGGAKGDLNGFTLTGVATTGELSPKLDSATTTAFLATV